MSAIDIRAQRLNDLSKMVVNGAVVSKLDHIATIAINGRQYFNVYRRYNSSYNIIIEDTNCDVYLHEDRTIRSSLAQILCLPYWESGNIYTWNATSYMHNGPPPSVTMDIADMYWTEVQDRYQAVAVNFGGIFHSLHSVAEETYEDVKEEDDTPSTPRDQILQTPTDPPGAPERPPSRQSMEAAHILLSLSIPHIDDPWAEREDDGPTLSMRFEDIQSRKRVREPVCYCEMHGSDDESDDEFDDDETVDNNNYTILRNGTMIPKFGTQ
jgi:hypothetical protein